MADLTEREMQVLHLISHGCENREIGRQIGISEDTAKTHVRNAFKKLHATGRAHAVRRGFETSLLLPYTNPNAFTPVRTTPVRPPETPLAEALRVTNPEKQLYAALQSLGWQPPEGGCLG